MKTGVVIAILLMGAALIWGAFAALARRAAEDRTPERGALREVTAELRDRALAGDRAAFALQPMATTTTPWGVVMETGFPEGHFTLVALSDGSASIYLSSGGGSIGGVDHAPIRNAAQAMVATAARFQPQATAVSHFPTPMIGQTVFYLLTDAGVFTAAAAESDLGEERHAWSPLFHAGHEVITQYRLAQVRK